MYSTPVDNKQNTRTVRATEEQRDVLMLSYKISASPSKAELALLSFQTNLDMEWINRWFMRQRAAERRRAAPPKPPKPVIDLTVKRELVDTQVDVRASSGASSTNLCAQLPTREEEEDALQLPAKEEEDTDSSSTHIPSSPTRYSVASSLPPSSPPSSPAPHTVKSSPVPPASYRDVAAHSRLRLFRGLPYEDPRARLSNASEVQAAAKDAASSTPQNHTPASAPTSAYMRYASRRQRPHGSAAIPVSATLATGRPAAHTNVLIAPMPVRRLAANPYLPGGPTSPALLPVSALPAPSSWEQYLSARARATQQARPATAGKTDATIQRLDAPAAPAPKTAAIALSSNTSSVAEQRTPADSPEIQEMLPLLSDLERETDVAKIAVLLAKLRRLGLQW